MIFLCISSWACFRIFSILFPIALASFLSLNALAFNIISRSRRLEDNSRLLKEHKSKLSVIKKVKINYIENILRMENQSIWTNLVASSYFLRLSEWSFELLPVCFSSQLGAWSFRALATFHCSFYLFISIENKFRYLLNHWIGIKARVSNIIQILTQLIWSAWLPWKSIHLNSLRWVDTNEQRISVPIE